MFCPSFSERSLRKLIPDCVARSWNRVGSSDGAHPAAAIAMSKSQRFISGTACILLTDHQPY